MVPLAIWPMIVGPPGHLDDQMSFAIIAESQDILARTVKHLAMAIMVLTLKDRPIVSELMLLFLSKLDLMSPNSRIWKVL